MDKRKGCGLIQIAALGARAKGLSALTSSGGSLGPPCPSDQRSDRGCTPVSRCRNDGEGCVLCEDELCRNRLPVEVSHNRSSPVRADFGWDQNGPGCLSD
jgi:hypothetical protein